MSPADAKALAHRLIDSMAPVQVAAAVGLLEVMLDPVDRAIANAPLDDEPVTEDDLRDIAESRASSSHGDIASTEQFLAEFGLTGEEFERMGRTPIESHLPSR